MVVAFALNKDGLNIEVLVALSSLNKFLVLKVLSFVFEVPVVLVVAVVPVVPVVAVVPVVPFVTVDKNFFTAENVVVDDEKDEVFNLLYKKQTQERELKAKLEQGEAIFSEQQIAASGIKSNRRLWLEAMYWVLHDTDNNDTKAAEVDVCIGFLVVLRLNGEFNYKGGLDDFFTLMKRLFGVEVDKNERGGIARYVQNNGFDFENWPDTPEKRFIRKGIAKRLWIAFDNKKRKWGIY